MRDETKSMLKNIFQATKMISGGRRNKHRRSAGTSSDI